MGLFSTSGADHTRACCRRIRWIDKSIEAVRKKERTNERTRRQEKEEEKKRKRKKRKRKKEKSLSVTPGLWRKEKGPSKTYERHQHGVDMVDKRVLPRNKKGVGELKSIQAKKNFNLSDKSQHTSGISHCRLPFLKCLCWFERRVSLSLSGCLVRTFCWSPLVKP